MGLVGIILAVAGAIILARGLTVTERRDGLQIGGASASERRAIPSWVGVSAVVGGVLLMVAGTKPRRLMADG